MLAVIFSFSKRGGLLNAAIGRFWQALAAKQNAALCRSLPVYAKV